MLESSPLSINFISKLLIYLCILLIFVSCFVKQLAIILYEHFHYKESESLDSPTKLVK